MTGRLIRPEQPKALGVVLAHGAGTNQDHASVVALRDGLASAGFPTLSFNYPYTEAGKKRPDAQAKLLECHRAVASWFRSEVTDRMVLAGRSMGGRMGTYLGAEGEPCDGLVLFAYPLHPPGRPEKLRKDHLPGIAQPMLFCVGTRDPLSTMALYDRWLRPLPNVTTYEVVDGNHSFRVPKASGRTSAEAFQDMLAFTVRWLDELPPDRR